MKRSKLYLLGSGVVLDLAGLILIIEALITHASVSSALVVLGLGIIITATAWSNAKNGSSP